MWFFSSFKEPSYMIIYCREICKQHLLGVLSKEKSILVVSICKPVLIMLTRISIQEWNWL